MDDPDRVSRGSVNHRRAVGYMLLSVLAYSLLPLGIVIVGGTTAPFLFGASQTAGHVIAGVAFLRIGHASKFRNSKVRNAIRKNLRTLPVLFSIFAPFTFALLAWSAAYIDIAASTIIWSSWPILLVLFLSNFDQSDDTPTSASVKRTKRRLVSVEMWILMTLGLLGLALVVLSQSDTGITDLLRSRSDLSLVGVAIAVGSAVLGSLSAWHFKWAKKLASEFNGNTPSESETDKSASTSSYQLFFVVACLVIGNTVASPVLALISIASSETFSVSTMFGGFAIGVLIRTPATILWRVSNLTTDNFGVNALNYLEPLISVLWLLLFWEIDITRVDYLIIGVCAVFASNILINAEAEIGLGFKATIVMLWISGVAVYFRDDRVLWTSEEYFSVLALSATVFAVILAFRVTRIVTTTNDEDQHLFRIAMELDALSRDGKLGSSRRAIFDDVTMIDTTYRIHGIREAYVRLLSEIRLAQNKLKPGCQEHSDLDKLAVR